MVDLLEHERSKSARLRIIDRSVGMGQTVCGYWNFCYWLHLSGHYLISIRAKKSADETYMNSRRTSAFRPS
jgi:hypothetical protein